MSILPYTPDLQLVESMIATNYVYVLKDPTENNEVFYVGKTIKDLKVRLSGHLSDSGGDSEKGKRIQLILDRGEKPVIEAIETIYCSCYIDKIKILEREHFWIRYYLGNAAPLTNVMGGDGNGKSLEYQIYLEDVRKNNLKWHYYYCGKTKFGINVYDEEKMNDDGFRFPSSNEHDMTPKENRNYVHVTEISYHYIYDDENTDYIKSSQEEI